MSSHLFEEVERTCERTAIIRQGEIAAIEDMEGLKKNGQETTLSRWTAKRRRMLLSCPDFQSREGKAVRLPLP